MLAVGCPEGIAILLEEGANGDVDLLDIARRCVEYLETCMKLIEHCGATQMSNVAVEDTKNLVFKIMIRARHAAG